MNTKCAPGHPGIVGQSCRCWLWLSSRSPASVNVPEHPPQKTLSRSHSTKFGGCSTNSYSPEPQPVTPSGRGHSGAENTKPPPAPTTITAGQNANEPYLQL